MTVTAPANLAELVLADFRAKHGRAPKILHVGNIANNAFLNAKILNEVGFDCDVMCADYYHIMGCPEWEDADFTGDIGDQFRPDWTRADLHGYQRPRWFAQGPQAICLEYLIAKRARRTQEADRRWEELGLLNRTIGRVVAGATGGRSTALRRRRLTVAAKRYAHAIFRRADAYELAMDKLSRWAHHGGIPARLGRMSLLPFVWAFFLPRRLARRSFAGDVHRWQRAYRDEFPDRDDTFEMRDYAPFASVIPRWKTLLSHYDVILGYATEGIYGLFADTPYFAFEHGTLREYPYRKSGEGRRTALCYRKATHVFVTNFDCVGSAEYLAPGRFTLINHPFDEDHALGVSDWESHRQSLREQLQCEFVFFFPTRHDWVPGTGYADKGNDSFLRAFAALRRAGLSVGAVCCEWGANVRESRALLEELGCAKHVKWIAPLPTVQFERMARATHCVVDQFVLGSFGGVMFKAMAAGAPVLTYLDEAQLLKQYPECPPVVNCRTEAQIVEAMSGLLKSPGALAAVGASARAWMKRYHSKHETVLRQVRAFAPILSSR